jgi:hypothetical protein
MTLPSFPDVDLPVMVEAGFGVDRAADPVTWQWTDLSPRRLDQPIPISRGQQPGATEAAAASCRIVLDNDDGQLTPLHPASQWWPDVDVGTPLRLTVTRNLNHDFEVSAEDWTAAGGTAARSTAQARAGVASLLLTPDGVAAAASANSGYVPVTPGRSWLCSGWVYSPGGYADPAGVALELLDGSQTRVSLTQASTVALAAATWTYHELWVEIPAGVAYARVWLTVTGSPAGSDTLHGDELRLRSVRFAGHVNSWQPTFIPSGGGQFSSSVTVEANGPLRRLGQGDPPLRSAIYRATVAENTLAAYWPLEDGTAAGFAASAVPGVAPARIYGVTEVETGAEPVSPGSGPSIRLTAGVTVAGSLRFPIPGRVNDVWAAESVLAFDEDTPTGTPVWGMTVVDGAGAVWISRAQIDGDDLTVGLSRAADDESAVTLLASEVVPRGTFHQLRMHVVQSGANISWQFHVDGLVTDVGTVTSATTAWPKFGEILADGLRVGHMAVYEPAGADGAAGAPYTWAAVTGYDREAAGRRVERLADEVGIQLQVVDEYDLTDGFDRTEASGWGDATTGQTWTTDGGSAGDFSVASGQGLIDQPTTSALRGVLIGPVVGDFDARVLVAVPAVQSGGAVGYDAGLLLRWADASTHYRLRLRLISNQAQLWLTDATGSGTLLPAAEAVDLGTYAAGDRFWLRARGHGSALYGRAWRDGDPEPMVWQTIGVDPTLTAGRVGVYARRGPSDATTPNEVAYEQWGSQSVLDETEPMGPQPQSTLVQAWQECATVDDAILYEHGFGLGFLPRLRRYNLDAALTVDMSTYRYSGDAKQVLQGLLDDQQMVNTFAAQRPEGSEAVVQDQAHTARHQLYGSSGLFNALADQQLPGLASWQVGKGVVAEMRAPTRQINLAANPDLIDTWLGVELGDRIARTNLPAIYPPGDVDRVLTSYTEVLGSRAWLVGDSGTPYAPWVVGVYAGDAETPDEAEPKRYSPYDSRVQTAFVVGTGTSLSVEDQTGGADLWSQTADFPFDLQVRGVRLRVTAVGAPAGAVQTMTVQQASVNGLDDAGITIAVGEPVQLWQPARYAL